MPKRKVYIHSSGLGGCPVCEIEPAVFAEVGDLSRISDPENPIPEGHGFRECVRCGLISLLYDQKGLRAKPLPTINPAEIDIARAYYKLGGRLSDTSSWAAFLHGATSDESAHEILGKTLILYFREDVGGVPIWAPNRPEGQQSEGPVSIDAADYPRGSLLVVIPLPEKS